MKVKELIADLQKVNQEVDVTIGVHGGCGGYEDTYEIFDVDEYEASKNFAGSVSVCVDKGCMCCKGTKTNKFTNRPQGVDQFWLGVDTAEKALEKDIAWYTKRIEDVGAPKTYKEQVEFDELKRVKHALGNVMSSFESLKRHGPKT